MVQPDLKPSYSSSEGEEEEETSGSEDEQTSGSDSEEVSNSDSEPKKKPLVPPPQAAARKSSDTEESGSETDSDSDSDSPPKKSTVADPNIKPISSKPMERDSKSAKNSGTKASSIPPPAKAKRPPPAPVNNKDAKKAKITPTDGDSKKQPKKPLIPPPQDASNLADSEKSGSDTDSGSDSDSPPKKSTVADPNIKPISSKPKNLDSKSAASSTPPPAKAKRPRPAKAKADDKSKKQLFQRIWSEEDEIVLLQGMIDYKTEKNVENIFDDMDDFHEFIKKSLHVDVSRSQFGDKLRRLKKKYDNNASKEKNGRKRSFTNGHEQKAYDLSKLIWGSSVTESKKTKPQKNNAGGGEKEGLTMEVGENMDVSRFVQYGRTTYSPVMEDEIMNAGLELVEGSKREELNEKWKRLKMKELELYLERMELVQEQAAIVMEAMKSSGN